MIDFKCPSCNRAFRVSDEIAGRRARCKGCGAALLIPCRQETESPLQSQRIVIKFDDLTSAPSTVAEAPVPVAQPVPPVATPVAQAIGPLIATTVPSAPSIASQPQPAVAATTPAGAKTSRIPVRKRRLLSDAEQMVHVFRSFPLIRVAEAVGNPPEMYRIEYHVRGLVRGNGGTPLPRDQHLVEIQLTRDYPRQSPKCTMVTPIFHPNIEPASICVGDHWTAGERLVDLVIRIGEMITYQAYNIKSPLDGEAAMWADLHRERLPIDGRNLRPPDFE